jgi:probable rRNA maturation factor
MSGITLVVEDKGWRKRRGIQSRLKQAAQVAARAARLKGEVTLLLAGDTRLRALNRAFRGQDKATNVLSFPGDEGGDIAIALGVTAREAKAQGKPFADHAIHLAVHGVLHLAGYDHARPRDARLMEPLEVKILKRLGIADPYVSGAAK